MGVFVENSRGWEIAPDLCWSAFLPRLWEGKDGTLGESLASVLWPTIFWTVAIVSDENTLLTKTRKDVPRKVSNKINLCPGSAPSWKDYFISPVGNEFAQWGWIYRAGKHGTWLNQDDVLPANSGDIN